MINTEIEATFYALGVAEGYIQSAVDNGEQGAEQALQSISIVSQAMQSMSKEILNLKFKITQAKLSLD